MAASSRAGYLPVRSYQKTMALFTVTGEGHISSVADCPSKAFAVLMQVAATTASDPAEVSKQLAGLDYIHLADRWFATELLAEHNAKLPLFRNAQEAEQAKLGDVRTAPDGPDGPVRTLTPSHARKEK